MKWVYVAHPYGGKETNKDKAENIIKELVKKDCTKLYISPIHAFGYLYEDVPYVLGMQYCFQLLNKCHELVLCKGWESSTGCNMERDFAIRNNIPIRYLEEV